MVRTSGSLSTIVSAAAAPASARPRVAARIFWVVFMLVLRCRLVRRGTLSECAREPHVNPTGRAQFSDVFEASRTARGSEARLERRMHRRGRVHAVRLQQRQRVAVLRAGGTG